MVIVVVLGIFRLEVIRTIVVTRLLVRSRTESTLFMVLPIIMITVIGVKVVVLILVAVLECAFATHIV